MKVRWQVEDGLVQGAQFTCHIDDDELAACETDLERDALIAEYVQSDFENKVGWAIVSKS